MCHLDAGLLPNNHAEHDTAASLCDFVDDTRQKRFPVNHN